MDLRDLEQLREGLNTGDTWRNEKHGTLYKIKGFTRHSETLGILVKYNTVQNPAPIDWSRPQDLFLEKFTFVRRSGYAKK